MRKFIIIILTILFCFFSCNKKIQQTEQIFQYNGFSLSPSITIKQINDTITIEQWIKMLCQAYEKIPTYPDKYLEYAYELKWVNETVFNSRDLLATYGFVLKTGLIAAKIPIYKGILETSYSLNLIDDNTITLTTQITRTKANEILNKLLSNKNNINQFYMIKIVNDNNLYLNDYLKQLKLIPINIINNFNEDGWKCSIDLDYLHQFSQKYNMSIGGLTAYNEKTLYVSTPSSLIHEFGHYVEYMLDFPQQIHNLYTLQGASAPIRQLDKINSSEYFAACFAYWIKYQNSSIWMNVFEQLAPQTYKYINTLFEESFK